MHPNSYSWKGQFKLIFNFKGRTSRKVYWIYLLINILGIILNSVLLEKITTALLIEEFSMFSNISYCFFVSIGLLFFLSMLSATVRRLHDTNTSGYYILIYFIPLIGFILLVGQLLSKSYYKENKYGPPPYQLVQEELEQDFSQHLIN